MTGSRVEHLSVDGLSLVDDAHAVCGLRQGAVALADDTVLEPVRQYNDPFVLLVFGQVSLILRFCRSFFLRLQLYLFLFKELFSCILSEERGVFRQGGNEPFVEQVGILPD